jgi:hypothetical protein
MEKLIRALKTIGIFSVGVAGHHFGGKILDRKAELEADVLQSERDAKLDRIENDLQELKNYCKELSNRGNKMEANQTLSDDSINSLNENLSGATRSGSKILEYLKESNLNSVNNEIGNNVTSMMKSLDNVKIVLDEIRKSSHNFISNFNLKEFYEYLDKMSLLQEFAFLHILIFLVLILTVLNILAVLFGNEIIKYFNIENKYPSLSTFLKLRYKFQRYYLLWNVFLLFILCIGGIGIDLLVFINS